VTLDPEQRKLLQECLEFLSEGLPRQVPDWQWENECAELREKIKTALRGAAVEKEKANS
jgi:hypothetical protein